MAGPLARGRGLVAAERLGAVIDDVATCGYIAAMETVGIRELKNHLSAYVRKVEAGDVVIVTDRGRIVAELRPPGEPTYPGIHPGLLELARRDGLRLPTRQNEPDLYRRTGPKLDLHGLTVQDLIDEQRGDR